MSNPKTDWSDIGCGTIMFIFALCLLVSQLNIHCTISIGTETTDEAQTDGENLTLGSQNHEILSQH